MTQTCFFYSYSSARGVVSWIQTRVYFFFFLRKVDTERHFSAEIIWRGQKNFTCEVINDGCKWLVHVLKKLSDLTFGKSDWEVFPYFKIYISFCTTSFCGRQYKLGKIKEKKKNLLWENQKIENIEIFIIYGRNSQLYRPVIKSVYDGNESISSLGTEIWNVSTSNFKKVNQWKAFKKAIIK